MVEHYVTLKTKDGTIIQVPREYAEKFKEQYQGKLESEEIPTES